MYEITINGFTLLGLLIASGITGAILMYGIKSIDKKECKGCMESIAYILKLQKENEILKKTTIINPNWKEEGGVEYYKGIVNAEIARRDDRERKTNKTK